MKTSSATSVVPLPGWQSGLVVKQEPAGVAADVPSDVHTCDAGELHAAGAKRRRRVTLDD